jgi:hypothetical protein
MSFSAPSDTFPLSMMCLEVRAMKLSYGDQARRALCRTRHTEYVQEPFSERKAKSIPRNISPLNGVQPLAAQKLLIVRNEKHEYGHEASP